VRLDVADDPDRGCLLYEAVVFQDTSRLTDDGWLERLEAITRLKARLAALEAETVAGFDDALHGVSADLGHRHPEPGDRDAAAAERRWIAGDLRSVADEIALVLTVRRGHAMARVHTCCELVHNFPATLRALSEGALTERAAFTIVSELSVLAGLDDLHAAEAAVLDWARTHPLVEIKQACRREAAHRSPAATGKTHQRARDERSVRMYPDDLGSAALVHDQDALDAAAVMTSLSRAAAHRRRHGDTRTMDQLRADIALTRLLPRTRHTTPHPTDTTTPAPDDARGAPADTNPFDADAPLADEPADDTVDEPADDTVDEPAGENDEAAHDPDPDSDSTIDPGPDPDGTDEAAGGAEATVVIHATGAEIRALITAAEATGGEADHHGPIPQSSLRKHLIKALSRTLLPNLPTTPTSPRPGAAVHRARTTTGDNTTNRANRANEANAANAANAAHGGSGGAGGTRGGSRIELRITDQPPGSDPDRYTPSAALDRYVRLRDRTCQFPGCNQPAEFTDLDHRIPFATGGRTTAANLWCLCRHHHRLKHEGGWQIHPNPDGTHTWTSPTRRQYRNNPTHPPDPTDP
jgi:hypothetical protein